MSKITKVVAGVTGAVGLIAVTAIVLQLTTTRMPRYARLSGFATSGGIVFIAGCASSGESCQRHCQNWARTIRHRSLSSYVPA
jgi:hypothetical protein